MSDGKIEAPVRGAAANDEVLQRFLAVIDDERKNGRPAIKPDRGDLFLRFNDPFGKRDRSLEFSDQLGDINGLLKRRLDIELSLRPEQRDELRRARRDYAAAKSDAERATYGKEIEKLVPGSADLNTQLRGWLQNLNSITTLKERPDPQECMRCHPRPKSYYDPNVFMRESVKASHEAFFYPRREDQFEARWAQIALDSPIVKANEALKQLPEMKVTTDDPVKLVKMGLTVAGVDMNSQTADLIEKVIGGIKGISKESGNRFTIERNGRTEIPFPQKKYLGAGIELSGLEIGPITFALSEGKYPELKDIKGLKVKLDVPAILNKIGRIDNEAEIQRIFMTRNEGTGDFQVNVEVVNPLPWIVRKAAHQFYNDVPENATIIVPIITLGPDGKHK